MKYVYEIQSCEKGHYRIFGKEGVYMDLLIGSEKALLFDTGYGYGNLKAKVRELTDLPLIIVNSHGHLDHVCGNYQFGETIYIHEKDVGLCKDHTSIEHRKGAVEQAKDYKDFVTGFTGNLLPDDFDETAYINGGAGNLELIKEGDKFELGGITLTVYELPGHTQGSIGLLWEEERSLFVGDAMSPYVWIFMPEALTLKEYRQSLDKIYGINFTHYYLGHNLSKMEKIIMEDYIDTADHVDFENGSPFDTPLAPGVMAKVCPRPGYGPFDMEKPGFASVVISEPHL